MKDIRDGLRERLKAIESQRENLQIRLQQLDAKREMFEKLLLEEDAEWSIKQAPLEFTDTTRLKIKGQIENFLLTTLSDGNPHRFSDLIVLARNRGLHIKDKRSINAPLQGLKRKDLVENFGEGIWKLKDNETTSVAGRLDDL